MKLFIELQTLVKFWRFKNELYTVLNLMLSSSNWYNLFLITTKFDCKNSRRKIVWQHLFECFGSVKNKTLICPFLTQNFPLRVVIKNLTATQFLLTKKIEK